MNTKIFRAMLSAAIACIGLGATVDLAFPSLVPVELARASDALPVPAAFSSLLPGVATAAWALLVFASLVGLFFFKAWSRPTLLVCTAAGFALYPMLGVSVASWASQALTDASSLLLGAVLALSYSEPISSRFVRRNEA